PLRHRPGCATIMDTEDREIVKSRDRQIEIAYGFPLSPSRLPDLPEFHEPPAPVPRVRAAAGQEGAVLPALRGEAAARAETGGPSGAPGVSWPGRTTIMTDRVEAL